MSDDTNDMEKGLVGGVRRLIGRGMQAGMQAGVRAKQGGAGLVNRGLRAGESMGRRRAEAGAQGAANLEGMLAGSSAANKLRSQFRGMGDAPSGVMAARRRAAAEVYRNAAEPARKRVIQMAGDAGARRGRKIAAGAMAGGAAAVGAAAVGGGAYAATRRRRSRDEITKDADAEIKGIVEDLAKLAETPEGAIKAEHIKADALRLTKLEADESIAMAKRFVQHGGELHKRIGQHWLDRAQSMIDGPEGSVARPQAPQAMPAQQAPQQNVHPRLQYLRDMARRSSGA